MLHFLEKIYKKIFSGGSDDDPLRQTIKNRNTIEVNGDKCEQIKNMTKNT